MTFENHKNTFFILDARCARFKCALCKRERKREREREIDSFVLITRILLYMVY